MQDFIKGSLKNFNCTEIGLVDPTSTMLQLLTLILNCTDFNSVVGKTEYTDGIQFFTWIEVPPELQFDFKVW